VPTKVFRLNGKLLKRSAHGGKLATDVDCCCGIACADAGCQCKSSDCYTDCFRWRANDGDFKGCASPCGDCVDDGVVAAGANVGGAGALLTPPAGNTCPCSWGGSGDDNLAACTVTGCTPTTATLTFQCLELNGVCVIEATFVFNSTTWKKTGFDVTATNLLAKTQGPIFGCNAPNEIEIWPVSCP
tara:strand:+ start:1076 stop:1633 length:558 start_codon:yes stop_codon:yes gene_type:complete